MRKIPFSILKRVNLLFRCQYSLVKRQGFRWVLNKHNWIDNRLLCFRGYEQKNIRLIKQILHDNTFDRFLDVGANIGYFSVHVAGMKTPPKIDAFEPMTHNYNQFCANIAVNDFSGIITAHKLALSDQTGETEIHYNSKSTGIATLNPDETVRSKDDYTQTDTIKAIVFDDVFKFDSETIFAKMDVEQHEIPALKGMRDLFAKNKVALLIEINLDNKGLQGILKNYGLKQIKADTSSDDYIFANFDLRI